MRYQKYMPIAARNREESPTAVKIVETAKELFLEKGFQDVTLRDIAERAQVNVSLIPHYFSKPTKENLGKRILMEMVDEQYRSVDYSDMKELNSAERLYVSNFLRYREVVKDGNFSRFYTELMDSSGTGAADVSTQAFVEMTEAVLREYNIPISARENEIYLTVLKGAELLLMYRAGKRELDISHQKMIDLIISNYFYNIGLPDQEIARIISHGWNAYEEYERVHS